MIQILLATYNGEKYIKEQLESLLCQTWGDWQVLIHDDGSKDDTISIVKEFCHCYPEKFKLIDDGVLFGNSRDNFAHLLSMSTADYMMFCDQDDVWLPEKIKKTYIAMHQAEVVYGSIMPIIVHSDLEIVDQDLNQIAPSMFDYQGLHINFQSLVQCLAKNSVTGCTMMLNSAARRVSLPISKNAIMHDWWIAAKVVQAGGIIEWINEPLIQYRQHGGNAVGAKRNGIGQFVNRILKYAFSKEVRSKVWRQAKEIDPSIDRCRLFLAKLSLAIRSLFQ